MAISAQQLKFSGIGFPVAEPIPPCRWLPLDLSGGIGVMDVQCPDIGKSAFNAFAAKRSHKRELLLPIFRMLVDGRTILVPISLLAFRRTIAHFARLAALLAKSVAGPARREIAFLSAIFSCAIPKAIGVHLRGLAAVSASDGRRGCSHVICISNYVTESNSIYFDGAANGPI